MKHVAIASALVALAVPAVAMADPPQDPLAEPARTVVADCQDNGTLDASYTRAELDQAEFQAVHYPYLNHPDTGNPEYQRPWEECGPMIDEALIQALGDSTVPLTDCFMDGRLEGTYSAALLDQAESRIPQQWDEVSPCRSELRAAGSQVSSAGIVAAGSPRWAKRALLRIGHRATKHRIKLRAVRRHGRKSFYGQLRWKVKHGGACYVEAVTRKVGRHRRVWAKRTGRYCTGKV